MGTEIPGGIRSKGIARRSKVGFLAVEQEINHCPDQNQRQGQPEQAAKRQASKASQASHPSQTHVSGTLLNELRIVSNEDHPGL
jgi:hypothetical protein